MRPQHHQHDDPEEGTRPHSQVAIFQTFVQSNLQAWIMMAAFEEDFDEKRGQKLRASKKLPQLVNYRSHDDVQGNCDESMKT
ncbi:hypothetical protein Lal_00019637 [Lupinus albus]|nr:hypothetical protein Lal_00019637 [Lupinus albus]